MKRMNKLVVIDPGHGGTDSGAVNGAAYEKDYVLRFAKALAARFEAAGVDAVLTRDTDKNVTLDARCATERAVKADCCISCHMDAGPETASGMTAWLHSKAPESYVRWAGDVLAELKAVGYASNRAREVNKGYRGNPAVDYQWNRETNSPSMLLELGFITNEENKLGMEKHLEEYAQAVSRATCEFLGVEVPKEPDPAPPETDYRALYEALRDRHEALLAGLENLVLKYQE